MVRLNPRARSGARSIARPGGRPRDPAPSRWRYRAERLWLRPGFRQAVRIGLPSIAATALVVVWAADGARRQAVADGFGATVDAVRDRPEFAIEHLRIEGAGPQLRADIEEAIPVDLPVSRFRLDLAGLREGLEALDPVRSATVRVRAGGVLEMRVQERVPAVAFMRDDGIDVLDGTGNRVATLELIEEIGPLPLIAGAGAHDNVPEALALTRAAEPIRDRLIGLVRIGRRRWDAMLTGDVRVMLPEASPVEAMDRALALHAAQDVFDREVAVLDLRLRGRTTVRMRDAAAERRAAARMEDRGDE